MVVFVGAAANSMGKLNPTCMDDQLPKMSCFFMKSVQCTEEAPDRVEVSSRPGPLSTKDDAAPIKNSSGHTFGTDSKDRLPPIPKVYIPKSLVPQYSGTTLPQHKRKMVDGIMQRLSIGPESVMREEQLRAEYASKVFRKRASSSGQAYEIGPKIHVIDNRESVPGALPTPLVRGSSSSSVFKSDACDTALRKYSATSPRHPSSDVKSEPPSPSSSTTSSSGRSPLQVLRVQRPHVRTPPLDELFRKPRTVAEKRLFLLQSPIEYKVMDFENSVYHLIKKLDRFRGEETFRTQVELLMFGSVPTNRNIWKAVLWLNSECQQYQPWVIRIDGELVRLLGATGTMVLNGADEQIQSKVPPNVSVPGRSRRWLCCLFYPTGKLKNEPDVIAQLQGKSVGSATPRKLIEKRTAAWANLKPGPLSAKVRRLENQRADAELGPLEIFELPRKTFVATPKVNRPLPRKVSSYLKLAVPDTEMTTDWLNYALSVLQPGPATASACTSSNPPGPESKAPQFHFSIPYKNDQRKILVRRKNFDQDRRKGELRNEDYNKQMKYKLTFGEVARRDTEEDLSGDVEQILTEMIDSVAVSFSEDFFIQNDPDLAYHREAPVKPLPLNAKPAKAGDTTSMNAAVSRCRSKLKAELNRLNVTIIDTAKMVPSGKCSKQECLHGCVCESLSRLEGLSTHCTKTECIFGCECTAEELVDGEQKQLRRIRDEKNSCLAPAEKEFKSTIVLTNSNTILLSNSDDRKRHRTKPKRFFDYLSKADNDHSDGSEDIEDPSDSSFGLEPRRRESMTKEKRARRWDRSLDAIRHCSVLVPRISQLDVLEPWCMVHELYRCFCGNQRVDGLPFKMQAAPDGSIRTNIKESMMLNNRRRPLNVAKDEQQQTLEPIPLAREPEGCSRCTATDFTGQIMKNRLNSELVNTKAKLSARKFKQQRLDALVEKCLNFDFASPMSPIRTSVQSEPFGPRSAIDKRLRNKDQFMAHAQNELGLKIASVCSLNTYDAHRDGPTVKTEPLDEAAYTEEQCTTSEEMAQDEEPAKEVVPESDAASAKPPTVTACVDDDSPMRLRLSDLKQKLLLKLNTILESCNETVLEPAKRKKVNFVRYRNFKGLLERMQMFEVWENGNALHLILGQDKKSLQESFPDSQLVDAGDSSRKFYLSKFVADDTSKFQSNNIYIVIEGSGGSFWYVRGCQYIKEIQNQIRIQSAHTQKLRQYAERWEAVKTNLEVYKLQASSMGHLKVRLPAVAGTRYLMIDLQTDFSDIGHPRWKGLLSCKHMKQALDLARLENKTIQVIRGPNNLRPNIFATPGKNNRIFAGPFEKGEPCMLSLYQRVDNSLYLREDYESMLNIKRDKQTRGFWLTNDQLSEGEEVVDSRPSASPLHSEDSGASLSEPPHTATVLPELEIVKATVKTERCESPAAIVSITAKGRSDSTTLQGSLLTPSSTRQTPEQPPAAGHSSFININELMANPGVSTFRVGSTIVKRSSSVAVNSVEAPPPPTEPDQLTITSEAVGEPEDDSDDVVLIEDNDSDRVIDLDEWERVQQELDAEEQEAEKTNNSGSANSEDPPEMVASAVNFDSESIPFSGYYKSNIPNLGNIPAKILNGVATLALPIRKMPVKIAVQCINRYMWKYLRNSVAVCFPKNLLVKWVFVNTFFPSEKSLFRLEANKHRDTCILTQFGVIDVLREERTEEDIPIPTVYLKYLASRLCVLVFRKLNASSANEIIEETLKVIKYERYLTLKNNREISQLKMKQVELLHTLSKLQEPVAGPSWAK